MKKGTNKGTEVVATKVETSNETVNNVSAPVAETTDAPAPMFEGLGIVFADVLPASRAKSAATMRADGYLSFTEPASQLLKATETDYFKIGKDKSGNIILVPALSSDKNVVHAIKNGEKLSIKNKPVFDALGQIHNTKYDVKAEQIGDIKVILLTARAKDETEEAVAGE